MFEDPAVGPVIVAKYLSPFQKLVTGEHGLEIVPGDEMIALPIDFRPARLASSVRNAEHQLRNASQEPGDQSRFAGAGGGGDDENGGHGRGSTGSWRMRFTAETQRRRDKRRENLEIPGSAVLAP